MTWSSACQLTQPLSILFPNSCCRHPPLPASTHLPQSPILCRLCHTPGYVWYPPFLPYPTPTLTSTAPTADTRRLLVHHSCHHLLHPLNLSDVAPFPPPKKMNSVLLVTKRDFCIKNQCKQLCLMHLYHKMISLGMELTGNLSITYSLSAGPGGGLKNYTLFSIT